MSDSGVYDRGTPGKPNWWIRYRDANGKLRRECGNPGRGACRSKRAAETLRRKRLKQIADGTLDIPERIDGGRETVASYGERWVAERIKAGKIRSAELDVARMRMHVVPYLGGLQMGQVTEGHYVKMLEGLEASGLAPKTVLNVHTMARTMFREAKRTKVIEDDPSDIPKAAVPKPKKKIKEIHSGAEALTLMTPSREPSMHIFGALALYTGMRQGEICGLRWSDLDGDAILLKSQYGDRPLKTDKPRMVPMHTELQRILLDWSENEECGDEFIVERYGAMYSRSDSYQAWARHCRNHGIRSRGVHVLRHTMITTARRGGADKTFLRRATHNPEGDIIDRYTADDWEPIKRAVECVRYEADESNGTQRTHGEWKPRKNKTQSKVGNHGAYQRSSKLRAKNSEKVAQVGRRKTPRKRGVEPTEHKCASVWALALAAERVGLRGAQ